ncbi:MAG: hypothetical protein D6725_05080 [Planctomycetota bacterium]|nr:MAG: hypothetical protein D6725_05080 [Planctomycetota bacterium]
MRFASHRLRKATDALHVQPPTRGWSVTARCVDHSDHGPVVTVVPRFRIETTRRAAFTEFRESPVRD